MNPKTLEYITAAKTFYQKYGNWDISDSTIINGLKLGVWWKNIKNRLSYGNTSDQLVWFLLDEEIDVGFKPLFQKEWHELALDYIKKYGKIKSTSCVDEYKVGLWYEDFMRGPKKDPVWYGRFENFCKIWNTKETFSAIPHIADMTPWSWAYQQYLLKELPYHKRYTIETSGIPFDDPYKIEKTIRAKVKDRYIGSLEKQLQSFIEKKSFDGVISLEPMGFLPTKWSESKVTYFRMEAYLNSMFTDSQYRDYVNCMKSRIYKKAKELFLKETKNGKVSVSASDVKLERMTSNKEKHRLTIVLKITNEQFAATVGGRKQEKEEKED